MDVTQNSSELSRLINYLW